MKEIKKDLSFAEIYDCSWINRLITEKMSIVPKLTYRSNTISIKKGFCIYRQSYLYLNGKMLD
jgi:hypothetical protein